MAVIRHVALRCKDMERTRNFYEAAFEWEFLGYRPSGAGLDLSDGMCNITLIQQPSDCDRPILEDGDEYVHFGVIVEDVQECWKRLEGWGAQFCSEAIKQGQDLEKEVVPERSFKVLDPDGNVVDVTEDRTEWKGVTI